MCLVLQGSRQVIYCSDENAHVYGWQSTENINRVCTISLELTKIDLPLVSVLDGHQ